MPTLKKDEVVVEPETITQVVLPVAAAPAPELPPKPADTVEVSKSMLEQMVADMAKLKEDNTMFREIADKGRMQWYQDKNPQDKAKSVKLTKCDGKLVMAWTTLKNVVQQDAKTGVWNEDQQYELILEDNSKVHINGYGAFATALSTDNKVDATVIEETKGKNGTTFKVEVEGREVLISSQFVN